MVRGEGHATKPWLKAQAGCRIRLWDFVGSEAEGLLAGLVSCPCFLLHADPLESFAYQTRGNEGLALTVGCGGVRAGKVPCDTVTGPEEVTGGY